MDIIIGGNKKFSSVSKTAVYKVVHRGRVEVLMKYAEYAAFTDAGNTCDLI
ncbi:MAG: hypothetical protein PUI28_07970 [Porcincola intestinalis]|nr:hypothetical protein [Porcincola intestinalis]MDD7060752.1 hypothetical protein [Porcincola intestinalis]MDY5283182.1 hypothetical protein [Porcincola intestinalis]MDY5578630.1 hypothetical protein [Porcincola intestinalis]